MSRRKATAIPDELLDQLLAGRDPGSALSAGGVLDELKRAFAERALNAELDHHLSEEAAEGGGNRRDCQDFRVRAGIVGRKEPPLAPTQGAPHP